MKTVKCFDNKSYKKCAVQDCPYASSGQLGLLKYHNFPNREKDPDRYYKWLSVCNKESLPKSAVICHKHFPSSNYSKNLSSKIIPLQPQPQPQGPNFDLVLRKVWIEFESYAWYVIEA